MIDPIKKELSKTIPAKYFEVFFSNFNLIKMLDSKIVFGIEGSNALNVKKHIENKYIANLEEAIEKTVGKRKIEILVQEKIDTTKRQTKSDKIDYDGEVHKLEQYLKTNVDIRFNEVFMTLEHKPKGFKDYCNWTDRDFSDLYLNIRRQKEYKYASKDTLLSILGSSAIPTFHPIKEYFKSLEPWDGRTDWIGKVCNCLTVSNELDFRNYLEKWCIRSLYSLFSDTDFSNEHCLIIQSRQGWFKSTFINGLIPKLLKPYYNSRIPEDLRSKDLVVASSKIWIWFLDEIDKITSKREAADLRDFLSSKGSFQRAAYARNETRFNRITNFIAACNKVEFLVDDTGNRRFIIFSLDKPIEIDKFQKLPIEKMWSQLYAIYQKTRWNQIHWTANEQKEIQENNLQYEYSNNEYEIILKYFRPLPLEEYDKKNKSHAWMSATEILLLIQEKHPGFKINTTWIGRGLTKMGFAKGKLDKNHRAFLVNIQ
jgi:predicted P-loop ATPase